ncbi:GDSL-type esterase/lipase family protein [Clostridium aestuarii]|uniref:GDSL-type esterase/lipase family protein n=1 Tax=Clostridium aestuarii TaxID=338193 RepID=A0ABT4D1T1_9CLOT|nr:GDSL-type esterase/lipase family protein [Clostridium aestuarii]MCY6485205.1 GDSL-type esterase/lipase family protein [Clostridium aestuarii]
MKIVCIGDSLTFGYGVNKNYRWTTLINNSLNNVELINKGANGDSTAGMLMRFHTEVVLNAPSNVIIMGGTNDFLINSCLNNVKENIKLMIKEATTYNIQPIIGIQIPIKPDIAKQLWVSNINYSLINEKLKEYRAWVINFSKENNIQYIDFYSAFIYSENTADLYVDGIHPTSVGHTLMAEILLKVLNKIRN